MDKLVALKTGDHQMLLCFVFDTKCKTFVDKYIIEKLKTDRNLSTK